jgi:hypothetical protein
MNLAIIRAAVIAIVVVAVGIAYLRSLPPDIVAVGTPVRQDDFLYTVTRVVKHRTHENISYIATIRVDNQAKRVDYRWSDENAYVTDSTGRRYAAVGSGSPDDRDRPPIAAGAFAEFDLAFVLPAAAQHPILHYWNGIMMGDVFDGAAYGRAAVTL